jgi:7,8-dihydropterin-6-yl-methyl-4-(beta-D-ribofuranosyl)aminobenzene 5'-phosphate synthase
MFYISGEIPRVTAFEHGLPTQHRQTSDGSWEPDPLVMDERWVAAHVKDKGLIVFTACSHAGVVNVLTHAQDCFPGVPLHTVIGGFHLSGGNEKVIPETVESMKAFGLKLIRAARCTGWRAIMALTQAFGEPVVAPSAVGKRYVFNTALIVMENWYGERA